MTHDASRNRALVITALGALGWSCTSSPPQEVKTATAPIVLGRTLNLTVTEVTRGESPPSPPNNVGLAFANFNVPPSEVGRTFPGLPDSVSLGTCDSGPNPNQTCSGLTLPKDAWTTSYTVDTNNPTTLTITGNIVITTEGFGAPTFFRCFDIGFDVNTNVFHPVPPHSNFDCNGQSGGDSVDPVTCTGNTCTAQVHITGPSGTFPGDNPWLVKMSFNVPTATNFTVPYFVESLLYNPPFDRSSSNYATNSTLSTTQTLNETNGQQIGLTGKGGTVAQGGINFTSQSMDGTSVVTQTMSSTGGGIRRADSFCADPTTCHPETDPPHDSDTFVIVFGVPSTFMGDAVLPTKRAVSIDPVSGTVRRFTVGELKGLAQNPPNYDVLCNAQGCDFDKENIAMTYMPTSADAQQILNMDPYYVGTDITAHPERFEPACPAGATCFSPESVFIDSKPATPPNASDVIVTEMQAHGNGMTSTTSNTTGVTLNYNLFGVLGFNVTTSYQDVTAQMSFTTRSASLQFDNDSHCEKGNVDLWLDKAFGSFLFVPHLQNACLACPIGEQMCSFDTGSMGCSPTAWGFEAGEPSTWSNSAETISQTSDVYHHSGTQSLMVTASTDPTLPASVETLPCSADVIGTMDVRNRTYSAWVFVNVTPSSYEGTQCRLRAFTRNFVESPLTGSTVSVSPIAPGSWFQLSGTFENTSTEQQIYELTVECKLPSDWTFGSGDDVWFIDDVQVD